MSKAILILDEMPERCEDCPLKADDGYPDCVKHVGEYPITETPTKGRQDWCPLREIPARQKIYANSSDYAHEYACGWNDCLDMIGGGND